MVRYIPYVLIFVLTTFAFGEDLSYYQKKLSKAQEDQAINLEKQIMAACCFGGTVYGQVKTEYTEKQKTDIRRLILEGKTDDEILDYFREEIDPRTGKAYGNRILAAPKSDELVGQISYWMVPFFAILGIGILILVIRKLRVPPNKVMVEDKMDVETLRKIESELSEYR